MSDADKRQKRGTVCQSDVLATAACGGGRMAWLLSRVAHIKRLNMLWRQLLRGQAGANQMFGRHSHVVAQDGRCITLAVGTSAWRSKLYYEQTKWLTQWQRHLPQIKEIRIVVMSPHTNNHRHDTPASPPPVLSAENIDSLRALSQRIDHPQLATALQRLREDAEKARESKL